MLVLDSDNNADQQQDGQYRHPHTEHAPGQVHGLLQTQHRAIQQVRITITHGMPGHDDGAGGGQQKTVVALEQAMTLFVVVFFPRRVNGIEIGGNGQ